MAFQTAALARADKAKKPSWDEPRHVRSSRSLSRVNKAKQRCLKGQVWFQTEIEPKCSILLARISRA
jgi:hypothetical protein